MAGPSYPPIGPGGVAFGPPGYGGPVTSPDLRSLSDWLVSGKILAIVVGVLDLIGFLAAIVIALLGFGFGWLGVFVLIGFLVDIALFIEVGAIQDRLEAGQYQAAKQKAAPWVVLGFIFGWVIVGIVLLIAYMKFDSLIARPAPWGPSGGYPYGPGAGYRPAPNVSSSQHAVPSAPPPTPLVTASAPASAPPVLAYCPRCGRPATWVPQYYRWFCYSEGQYL